MTVLRPLLTCLLTLCCTLLASAQSVGLVLSGGGAKGIAHMGVIRALEENDIPIDYVTGTSMGAVVGSLYACGKSPQQMLDLVTSGEFANWSMGRIDPALTYYFDRRNPDPAMLNLQFDFRDSTRVSTDILPGALINPLPMNFAFMELFSPYTAQCREDFDRLFVPFRCVCSDVYHKHKIVLSRGSLGNSVRASMSFPMVYKPIEMDGVLVFDGGIYDNFPVDVMEQDFNPDFIIGVSVSAPDGKPQPGNMFSQLEDMIIQNNDYNVPADKGIKIQVPVLNFGVLDFQKGREIYEIGYRTGLAMVDSVKQRIAARRPEQVVMERRAGWNSRTPRLEFDSIHVSGIPANQERYIANMFDDKGRKLPFGVERARDSYYRLISSGKVSDMRPQAPYDSVSGMFDYNMEVDLKRKWTAGVGGWVTSSANSMLYMNVGYHTLSYNSLDAVLSGWIGQSYYAGFLSTRFSPGTDVPTYVELQACASRRKDYNSDVLFYKGDNPAFVTDAEQYVRLNYAVAAGRNYKAQASIGHAWQTYGFFPEGIHDYARDMRDKARYKVAALKLEFDGSTLDNAMYPGAGRELHCSLWGLYEHASFENHQPGGLPPSYKSQVRSRVMAEVLWRRYFSVARHLSVGLTGNLLGSAGKLGGDYTATMIHAPGFGPTPSTRYYFNTAFRAFSYAAIGVSPVWSPISNLQLRADMYLFTPLRDVVCDADGLAQYGGWLKSPQFLGEVAAVYNFNFASLALYCNYLTHTPRNCNVGISFGLMFDAPRFIR